MSVIICGMTQMGEYISDNIYDEKKVPVKPVAFVDNNVKSQGMSVNDIPVISFEKLLLKDDIAEMTALIAVKNSRNIFQIMEQLEQLGIKNIGVVKARVVVSKVMIELQEESEEIIWKKFEGKRNFIIPRIETNLIDACNLKCKGCSHFSSIYSRESHYYLNDYKNDILQLRKVGKLLRIRLLGGEPFLLDNLDEYIDITRDIFSETDIEIVTNGLLIPNASEKVLLSIKKCKVCVTISLYKPTLEKAQQIAERLDKYNIWWQFDGDKIEEFSRRYTLENTHNALMANKNCLSSSCTFLRKGKLYKCPFEGLVNDFYQYYGLNKKYEGGIELDQEPDILYEKIVQYISNPIDMCQCCVEIPEMIPWSVVANPILQDWLYMDGI